MQLSKGQRPCYFRHAERLQACIAYAYLQGLGARSALDLRLLVQCGLLVEAEPVRTSASSRAHH